MLPPTVAAAPDAAAIDAGADAVVVAGGEEIAGLSTPTDGHVLWTQNVVTLGKSRGYALPGASAGRDRRRTARLPVDHAGRAEAATLPGEGWFSRPRTLDAVVTIGWPARSSAIAPALTIVPCSHYASRRRTRQRPGR